MPMNIPTQYELLQMSKQIPELKYRSFFVLSYLTAGRIGEVIRTLKKKDIQFVARNNRQIMLVTMRNEKNRKRDTKDIPIPTDKEGEFVSIVKQYIDTLDMESVLFPFSAVTGWKKLKKYLGLNPHKLRHIRLTHLVTLYDFGDQLLIRYAGWTDSRPAQHYMELRWHDFLDRM